MYRIDKHTRRHQRCGPTGAVRRRYRRRDGILFEVIRNMHQRGGVEERVRTSDSAPHQVLQRCETRASAREMRSSGELRSTDGAYRIAKSTMMTTSTSTG